MYKTKEKLKPTRLIGISDAQINDHWKLYEGYVKQVNVLNDELTKLDPTSLAYADRRRRYGFEYNGMVLHEYYFENLTNKSESLQESSLKKAIMQQWHSIDAWSQDFTLAGKTRGIGWAILYTDPESKLLTNHFISNHEYGHIAGFKPILVMDVWEHAYMVDHGAGGRADYITAFLQNINWKIVIDRYNEI